MKYIRVTAVGKSVSSRIVGALLVNDLVLQAEEASEYLLLPGRMISILVRLYLLIPTASIDIS